MSPKLTLNLGLRYGANQPIKEKRNRLSKFALEQGKLVVAGREGQPETLYDWDKNNFAPRFGFAWTPFDNKTVLRGGYGVFYDTKLTNNFTGMSLNTPFRTLYVFQNAAGQAPAFVLNGLFPSNLATAPASTLAVNGVLKKYPDGYSQQWSFNVQRELRGNLMVELGYVGSKGTKLDRGFNPNQPAPGAGTAAQIQARRPYPQYAGMTYRIAEASSIYHSGQLRVEKRYSQGVSFLTSYTWGKAIDNASLWNAGAQDSFNLRGERGLSNFDLRHRLSYSYTWDLPFGRERAHLANLSRAADAFLGGWQLSGIVTLQTGQPITPGAPGDRANIGAGGQRPNAVGNPNLPRSQRDPSKWFNPSAYRLADLFTFGNAARNSIEGPGLNNFDMSFMKNFKFGEQRRVQLRAEFFNIFNHPNFDPPNGVATTVLTSAGAPAASAGVVNSAKDSRQLQFGLKFYY